jgi:predicted protein tyrosine phosphatase
MLKFGKLPAYVCGLSELENHKTIGMTHVLSILDPGTPEPTALANYVPHRRTTLYFHDEIDPGANWILPQAEHIEAILSFGRSLVDDAVVNPGQQFLVHCHMGISRSTAALITLLALIDPTESEDAIMTQVLKSRPEAWPNCLMVDLADVLLERNGRLSAALGRLYAVQLKMKPEMGIYLRANGRGREVDRGQQS